MSGTIGRERLQQLAEALVVAVERVVIGQRVAVEALVAGYLAGGHVIVEGVPGVGKTLLARTLARALGLPFARVQFTPDLMPTDLVGMNVFDPVSRTFRLVKGPVFTSFLMADEINRTPPKTQSALLEAMEERQVTIDGTSHALVPSFFVVATENPVEFEGTYPLPEAQLDRFLLQVDIGLPAAADEITIYQGAMSGGAAAVEVAAVATEDEALALRRAAQEVHVGPELLDYLARLAGAVRASPHVDLGPSPRGGIALLQASRAAALLAGRDFVLPDDFKRFLVACWGHRTVLSAESELEGHTTRTVLDEIARTVAVPHTRGA